MKSAQTIREMENLSACILNECTCICLCSIERVGERERRWRLKMSNNTSSNNSISKNMFHTVDFVTHALTHNSQFSSIIHVSLCAIHPSIPLIRNSNRVCELIERARSHSHTRARSLFHWNSCCRYFGLFFFLFRDHIGFQYHLCLCLPLYAYAFVCVCVCSCVCMLAPPCSPLLLSIPTFRAKAQSVVWFCKVPEPTFAYANWRIVCSVLCERRAVRTKTHRIHGRYSQKTANSQRETQRSLSLQLDFYDFVFVAKKNSSFFYSSVSI